MGAAIEDWKELGYGYLERVYQRAMLVEEVVIVELKTAEKYYDRDEAQLLNQLKATGVRVGMLMNFGREKAECRRFIY